jgi:hypothetical protein
MSRKEGMACWYSSRPMPSLWGCRSCLLCETREKLHQRRWMLDTYSSTTPKIWTYWLPLSRSCELNLNGLRYNIVTFFWILFYCEDEKKFTYTIELEAQFWLPWLHGGEISALGWHLTFQDLIILCIFLNWTLWIFFSRRIIVPTNRKKILSG